MAATTLATAIVDSLRFGEMTEDVPRLLLSPSRNRILKRNEGDYWEFKRELDIRTQPHLAKLAKCVLGFHNAKGGVVIVGVRPDDYSVVGVSRAQISDRSLVTSRLQKYVGTAVQVFVDEIEVDGQHVLWLIFTKGRVKGSPPIALQADAPQTELKKNDYFVRDGSDTRKVIDPLDFERLFGGFTGSARQAYGYERDDPFFRLLEPHCQRFVGRIPVIDQIAVELSGRHPIVGLDGMGGVGKSAIAIEVVRRLYDAAKYQFIISLSAKSRVWQGHTGARRAGFTGFTEFIAEIASVLQLEVSSDSDQTKDAVVSFIAGSPGLLLIDNIEDVQDPQILEFLGSVVPDPVKVFITSRIDRGIGGKYISVPEMNADEARELLVHELSQAGFPYDYSDPEVIAELLEATGRLPLALKWAAGLAAYEQSLARASQILRGSGGKKREFLNFCFATMFDTLTPVARDTALLCPLLREDWSPQCVALALEQSEEQVKDAFDELERKGIILASPGNATSAPRVLSLTFDYLTARLNQYESFRRRIRQRLDDVLATPDTTNLFTSWLVPARIKLFKDRTKAHLAAGKLDDALGLIRVARTWADDDPELLFLHGQIEYERQQFGFGIELMRNAIQSGGMLGQRPGAMASLGSALVKHGSEADQTAAQQLLEQALCEWGCEPVDFAAAYVALVLQGRDYQSLSRVLTKTDSAEALMAVVSELEPNVGDAQLSYQIGEALLTAASRLAREEPPMRELASRIRKLLGTPRS